jgi:hypothetical protein
MYNCKATRKYNFSEANIYMWKQQNQGPRNVNSAVSRPKCDHFKNQMNYIFTDSDRRGCQIVLTSLNSMQENWQEC